MLVGVKFLIRKKLIESKSIKSLHFNVLFNFTSFLFIHLQNLNREK
jgi:hypothetical protein